MSLRYSQIKESVLAQWSKPGGNRIAYFITGKPGGGKSALSRDVVQTLGIDPRKVVEFNPSLRDPVDVLGTPNNNGECTRWVPPEEFYKIRKGQGRCALIIEEMTDAPVPMQNALCRVILDRHAGQLELSDELFIIASGNSTEHKSGATRLTTKLGNRMRIHEFQENLDDWVNWAMTRKPEPIDPVLIQFIRFKSGLLSDFKPDAPYGINPTPRAWERVSMIPTDLRSDLYLAEVSGDVGSGPAAEYTAFRKIYEGLISFDEIIANPTKVKVPTELNVKFAIVGSLSHHTTVQNLDKVAQFVSRLESDFEVMYWVDTIKRVPEIKGTKPFTSWAANAKNVLRDR